MFGILCFGDSITFGRGETHNIGWCGRLKAFFEAKDKYNAVYNLGIPGNTSYDLLQRFDIECKARIKIKRPRDHYIILIAIGSNDCKWDGMPEQKNPRMKEETFRKNMRTLLKKAKSYPAQLGCIGLPPVDETRTLPYEETSFTNKRVAFFNKIVKECCSKEKVLFLDMFKKMHKRKYTLFLEDGVHPNKAGYDFMYSQIKTWLENVKNFPLVSD